MLNLSPELLQTAGSFELLAENLVEGFIHGLHRSPFKGQSQEFASYRGYQPGEPVRAIDWKLWARTDSLFVREFEEDTNFRGYLFLDTSRSMDYGKDGTNKFLYARYLCATLAILMARQKDAPGFAPLHGNDTGLADWFPPSTRQENLLHLLSYLENLAALEETETLGNRDQILEFVTSRSLAIIIADGLYTLQESEAFLSRLRGQGAEILFFHLLHPDEIDPPFEENTLLIDNETGREMPVGGRDFKNGYQDRLDTFLSAIEDICHRTESDYCRIVTSEPLENALQVYLQKRGGRG